MNKELFVSSTPHETKVGLVEDDLLAEIYLERENEYTLAGSIYKGRVTRVLPGMQSAFVDIGLERDAFLYVSDFMELEEQDEDLTEAVPANRAVQDLRPQVARVEPAPAADGVSESQPAPSADLEGSEQFEAEAEAEPDQQPSPGTNRVESGSDADFQNRERGGYRGRRRRRGGRRDGREGGFDRNSDRGPDRNSERSPDRGAESRFTRPAESSRTQEFGRSQPSGPPPGYTPIILPGESISKYQRWTPPPAAEAQPAVATETVVELPTVPGAPVAAAFPEDEPIFAAGVVAEPVHEEHEEAPDEAHATPQEPAASAAVPSNWNQEFRRPAEASAALSAAEPSDAIASEPATVAAEEFVQQDLRPNPASISEPFDHAQEREEQVPVFAAPGTIEEETIEEEEADAIRYETSSDEGYEEFEEETRAAGPDHLNGDAREAVSEIHASSLEGGPAHGAEVAPAEGEEDSEELELEEAQAEAEAMLEAEARGNGTVDARVEVRAPSSTAGYTQRAPRPAWERRNQRGRRSGGGGGQRRFRRRESAPVPLISDLLKEGQEILVQIAKEPIGKKGARITSHIALPGRFLVYMPTVNHTGVSRKISSEEERQRLKRIILSERENGHGGFIVRTAAQNASEDELRADIRFLKGLWNEIRTRAENSKPPALIYHDLNVVERVLRDQVTSDFNVIWVDTEPEYERVPVSYTHLTLPTNREV